MPTVVAVWNELTPYRLHVMKRVRDELPAVRVVNVFTHSVTNNSSPWAIDVPADLNVVFDEVNRIPAVTQFAHRNALRLVRSIQNVIREERPVFVLMHGHSDLTRFILIRRLARAGIPMVHASDANIFCEQPSHGWKRAFKTIYRAQRARLLAAMDGYMPMGVAGRAFYALNGRPSVPNFIFPYEPDYADLANFPASEVLDFRARQRIDPQQKYFLCSSRLVDLKRVDLVVDAFNRIARDFPDWSLMIAGDGPRRRELESRVKAHLVHRTRFLGFVQMTELRCAYASASCFVHASEREPWGLVINEAANAGLPIVATNVTGAAIELVRDGVNGRMVPVGEEVALADAMRWIAGHADLGSLRQASRRLLQEWRAQADPVAGFRSAVDHFASRKGAHHPN